MRNGHEFGRLKEDALATLSKEGFPSTRRLFRWMRKRPHPVRVSEHHYVRLKAGEPVPWPLIAGLTDYLAEIRHRPIATEAIAERAAEQQVQKTARVRDAWTWGWARLYGVVTDRFHIAEEAFCLDEADIDLAAGMALEYVGRMHFPASHGKPSKDAAIAFGEQFMARSRQAYAKWLRGLWEEDPRTVLFSVVPCRTSGGMTNERWGLWVSVPLKKSAFERYRKGGFEDSQFKTDDYETPANFVYLHMAAQGELDRDRGRTRLSLVQLHTLLYQMSMLVGDVKRNGRGPTFLGIAGTPENEQRMRTYGFVPVETQTPASKRNLYELAPRDAIPAGAPLSAAFVRSQYDLMWGLLRLYQALFADERRALDMDN